MPATFLRAPRHAAVLAASLLAALALHAAAPPETGPVAPAARPAVPNVGVGDWLVRAREHIAEREYRASGSGQGLQAPNRAHDLRTWFEPTGVRVHDRTASDTPELLALRLTATGRPGALAEAGAGEVASEGNRVEILRAGVVEWYVNSAAGLEQGFTLSERPAGDGPLVLELGVAPARASLHGDAVVLATPAGRRLRYGELVANDAEGRVLVARIEVPEAQRIRLIVRDDEAVYPVVVDPLLTELPEGLGFLGSAGGIADGGPATAHTRLQSDQGETEFGRSVTGAGDVNGDGYDDVIVGAPFYDAGSPNEGAAFVFLGSATGIAHGSAVTAHAQLESNRGQSRLGWDVAGAGDVNGDGYDDVIVGSPFYDAGELNEGAAFVFLGSAAGIASGGPAAAHARLESDQQQAEMGASVAGAGDVNGDGYDDVIVGAPLMSTAFVFLGSATGIGDGHAASAHARFSGGGRLGAEVSGAGDVNGDGYDDVVVSAPLYNGSEGVVLVFLGGAAGIGDGDVASADTRLLGVPFSYALAAGVGDVNGDGFDDVLMYTGLRDVVWLFLGSSSGIADGDTTSADARIQSDQVDSRMGSAAAAGDVDGDGYDDLILGAYLYDTGEEDEGAAFVFLGSATGIASGTSDDADTRIEGDVAGGWLGVDAAGVGDVNGDGYDDVMLGAPYYGGGQAFLFLGNIQASVPSPACDDGLDNDGDLLIDLADPGCADETDADERSALIACDNGIDDDGDGATDLADVGCRNSYGTTETPQCQDGVDNDGQTGIDFDGGAGLNDGIPIDRPDPQCTFAWIDREEAACGLGAELVGLLALLHLARVRRR